MGAYKTEDIVSLVLVEANEYLDPFIVSLGYSKYPRGSKMFDRCLTDKIKNPLNQ